MPLTAHRKTPIPSAAHCDDLAVWTDPVHVPMSPLGEDRCVGEEARIIWNSLEVSGRFRGFWGFLEGCDRKVPEEMGISYIERNGTLPV